MTIFDNLVQDYDADELFEPLAVSSPVDSPSLMILETTTLPLKESVAANVSKKPSTTLTQPVDSKPSTLMETTPFDIVQPGAAPETQEPLEKVTRMFQN